MTSYAPVDIIFDSDAATEGGLVTGTKDCPVYTLVPSIEDCVGVAVTYANIPFTYYVIDNTNNEFVFWELSPVLISHLIKIEPGSYNSVSLATQIKTKIIAACSLHIQFAATEVFVDSTTSKLVIYTGTDISTSFKITFDYTTPQKGLAKILGFNQAQSNSTTAIQVVSNTDPFLNDSDVTLVSTYNISAAQVINLTGPSQMFLDSDFGSAIFGSVRNQAGNRGLLGFWPVNNNYQGIIEYINPNPVMIPMTSTNLSRLTLSLTIGNRTTYQSLPTSPLTSYLQLNGEPFQVGLRFWRKTSAGVEGNDIMGNRTVGITSSVSRVFQPRKISRTEVRN